MSISKLSAFIFVLLFLQQLPLNATTIVVVVSGNGVVVSSDSLTTSHDLKDLSAGREKFQDKFVVLHNRIVVGSVGLAYIDNPAFKFDFLTWMHSLETKLPDNVSVDDVERVIEKESPTAFGTFYSDNLRNNAVERKSPDFDCEDVAEFVIAGYQQGVPTVYKVKFDIDWNTQSFVGPTKIAVYAQSANAATYEIRTFGVGQAITDILNRNSYAHQQALRCSRKAMTKIDGKIPPSLDETAALSRVLVQVEENTNPDSVGGAIRTVEILPDGRTKEYALPKHRASKNQKNQ